MSRVAIRSRQLQSFLCSSRFNLELIKFVAMPLRNLLFIAIAIAVCLVCYRTAAKNRYANLFAEAMDVVDAKSLNEIPREQLFDAAMTGMFGELDKHSLYISGDMYREFDESMSQKFGGLGVFLEKDPESQAIVVLAVVPNTPAQEAGLKSGDRIVSADGTSTLELTRDEGSDLLRGDVGEATMLAIERGEEKLELEVTRQIISIESVVGDFRDSAGNWNYFLESNPRIGYLRLRQFGERTSTEVAEALKSIDGKVDGVIVDLRQNSGGLLTSAISICDMFLGPAKEIVSTQGRNRMRQNEHFSTEERIVDDDIAVVVLVNRFSASASEIVAGCLQDHERATLIGEQSWGKGTVQNIIPVRPDVSVMKLTTASYWRPSGKPIDRGTSGAEESGIWGVRPDEPYKVSLSVEEVIRNERKRNLRDIETLIPVAERASLLPILLGGTFAEPSSDTEAEGDSSGGPEEDSEVPSSTTELRDWVDPVMQRAIETLAPAASKKIAA